MAVSYELLSVIIPVYNERSTISEVIDKVSSVDLPIAKEIIVIDDGSTDGTIEKLESSSAKLTHTYLTPVNVGKGAAVRIGLSIVKGDIVLIQDADLELDPGEFRHLIDPILCGKASVVFGSRFLTPNNVPPIRRLANYLLTISTNMLYRTKLTDMATAYKVFTRDVASRLDLRANRFEIDAEMTAQIALMGYTITEVPISYRPRTRCEGRKLVWQDGFKALATLITCRFRRQKEPLERQPTYR